MIFGTSKRLNKLETKEMKISGTTSYKYHGVHLDQTVNFEDHFNTIYKQAAGRSNLLRKIRGLINSSTVELIYGALIKPVFGYRGLIFLARSQSYKNRTEGIERRAGAVITSNNLTVDLCIPNTEAVIKNRA